MMSQSWIMMYAAGGAWQYGKRRISAMSNEEFNKLLPIDLLKEHTEMLRSAIPTIQKSIQDMTPLIETLMTQFGTFINKAIEAIPQTVSNILGTPGGEFSQVTTTADLDQTGKTGLPPFGTAAFLHAFLKLSKATQKDVLEEGDTSGPSTIPGLTVFQAQAQSLQKQIDFEAQKRLLDIGKARKTSFTTGQITDIRQARRTVTGATAPVRFQKKAGQSQYMERKLLIGKIANAAHNLRSQVNPIGVKRFQAIMEMWQQRLVNLLDRYSF